MKKEDYSKEIPIIIDVPNEALKMDEEEAVIIEQLEYAQDITLDNALNCSENEKYLNFELREPGLEERDGAIFIKVNEDANEDQSILDLKKVQREIPNSNQQFENHHRQESEEELASEKIPSSEDTSFKQFKEKQYKQERDFRIHVGEKVKRVIGKCFNIFVKIPIYLFILVPAYILAVGLGVGIAIGGVIFSFVGLGIGVVGLGAAAFLKEAISGTMSEIILSISILSIGITGLLSLVLFKGLALFKDYMTKVYTVARKNKKV